MMQNKNQQTGYPAEIHILLSQQLKRPFALLSGAPDSYSILSSYMYLYLWTNIPWCTKFIMSSKSLTFCLSYKERK